MLRVHIANLRRKIEPSPGTPALIRTDPGIGYRFSAEPIRPSRDLYPRDGDLDDRLTRPGSSCDLWNCVTTICTSRCPAARTPLSRRLAARVKRFGLDRALAAGEDPHSDPLLACRAEQLGSAPARRRIAGALRGVVQQADRPVSLSAAVPTAPSVRALRDTMLTLAARLEGERAVGIRGVAKTNVLLTDPASPLFGSSTVDELEDALEDAIIGLGS